MSQLRLLTDNAADGATLTASNTAVGMGVANLKTDIKGQACRVLGDTTQIVAVWGSLQSIGAVVIPASSLGASSTIRVRAYLDDAGADLLHDTGVVYAASGTLLANWGFTQPLNVNQFAYGFPPSTAVYLPEHYAVRRVVIDIVSPGATFIDISRLLIGPFTTVRYNASYGQSDGIVDLSQNSRAASGDLKTEVGPKAKRLSFSLGAILADERAKIKRVLDLGIGRFVWADLLAGDADAERERDKSIYGKMSQPQSMTWANSILHNASFEIEGF